MRIFRIFRPPFAMSPMTIGMTNREYFQHLLQKDPQSEERLKLLSTTFLDNFMPVHQWPRHEMERLLGSHLGYNDRCSFVQFCSANQVAPWHIVMWAKAQPGWLRSRKAHLDMAGLIKKWRDGTFESQGKTEWNVEKRELVPQHTPSFAKEEIGRPARDKDGNSLGFWFPAGKDFFDDAIRELECIAKSCEI